MDQFLRNLAPPVSSFLILLFRLNSHLEHRGSLCTYLPGLLRPTREGAQGGAPSTIQAGTCGLRRRCKPLVSGLYWLSM